MSGALPSKTLMALVVTMSIHGCCAAQSHEALALPTTKTTRARGIGRSVDLVALLLVSTPALVSAYVARTVFGIELRWLPVSGVASGWTSYVLPVLSLAANLGQLITALIIVEGVFGVPGVGGLLFEAIGARARSVVVGVVTFVAVLVIAANALADMVVAALDPRIRLES